MEAPPGRGSQCPAMIMSMPAEVAHERDGPGRPLPDDPRAGGRLTVRRRGAFRAEPGGNASRWTGAPRRAPLRRIPRTTSTLRLERAPPRPPPWSSSPPGRGIGKPWGAPGGSPRRKAPSAKRSTRPTLATPTTSGWPSFARAVRPPPGPCSRALSRSVPISSPPATVFRSSRRRLRANRRDPEQPSSGIRPRASLLRTFGAKHLCRHLPVAVA